MNLKLNKNRRGRTNTAIPMQNKLYMQFEILFKYFEYIFSCFLEIYLRFTKYIYFTMDLYMYVLFIINSTLILAIKVAVCLIIFFLYFEIRIVTIIALTIITNIFFRQDKRKVFDDILIERSRSKLIDCIWNQSW